MRWLPFLLLFLLAYIEITLFIKVAILLGVAVTLLLVIFTSCMGISLVRKQGIKTFVQMQHKLAAGESPAAEMVKSVSLVLAGVLLLVPGFFTDFLGLLLLFSPLQKFLTLKLIPYLHIYHPPGARRGNTFEGEFRRKDETAGKLLSGRDEQKQDRSDP